MTDSNSAQGPSDKQQPRKRIIVRRNGPYETEPGIAIVDHLGVPVETEPPS